MQDMNLISESQINHIGSELLKIISEKNNHYDSVRSPENSHASSLVFASSLEMITTALKNNVKGLIILEKKYAELASHIPADVSVWTTPHIQYAMTRILPLFDKKKLWQPASGIHPTASVHPDAIVSSTASVGPFAVIEAFARVEDHAVIGAHTVVQAHSIVGQNSLLSPHVVVGFQTQIGRNCIIASHVTLGSDGFGFFTDATGKHHKVPQIGIVVIEDDCEIGANCAIDRAALEETRIKKGTKLDNFCHIAHNVEFGENGLAAAALKVAGSTKIGKSFMCGGNVDITGHVEVCDKVILAGRSGVTNSIEQSGFYGGFPLENHRDSLKTLMSITHISKIRKQVNKIMTHLNLKEN